MIYISYYTPCIGMNIQYLRHPQIFSSSSGSASDNEESKAPYEQNFGIASCPRK